MKIKKKRLLVISAAVAVILTPIISFSPSTPPNRLTPVFAGSDLRRPPIPMELEKVAEGFKIVTDMQFVPPVGASSAHTEAGRGEPTHTEPGNSSASAVPSAQNEWAWVSQQDRQFYLVSVLSGKTYPL